MFRESEALRFNCPAITQARSRVNSLAIIFHCWMLLCAVAHIADDVVAREPELFRALDQASGAIDAAEVHVCGEAQPPLR